MRPRSNQLFLPIIYIMYNRMFLSCLKINRNDFHSSPSPTLLHRIRFAFQAQETGLSGRFSGAFIFCGCAMGGGGSAKTDFPFRRRVCANISRPKDILTMPVSRLLIRCVQNYTLICSVYKSKVYLYCNFHP